MAAVQETSAVATLNYYTRNGKNVTKLFEDDKCIVIDEEENRQASIHYVVVPKKRMPRVSEATVDDEKMLGHLLVVAKNVAISKGLDWSGYHVILDEDHRTHSFKSLHVFGRALHHMLWPVGPGSRL